jgi:hypothetical protein
MKTTSEEHEMSGSTNTAKSPSTSESASAAALVRRAPDAEVLEADPTSVITLLDRLHEGDASVQDLYDTQDHFDNHYVDSPAWQANR